MARIHQARDVSSDADKDVNKSRACWSRCDGEPESRTGNGEAGRQTAAKRWWRGDAAAGACSGQGARRGLGRVDASLSLPSADRGLSATPAPVSSVVFLFVLRSGQSQLCSRRFFRSFSFVFSFCSVHCRLQSAEAVAGRVESWSVSVSALDVICRLQLALSVVVACVCPLRSWSPRLAVRGWSRETVPAASATSSSILFLPCSQRCLLACSQR